MRRFATGCFLAFLVVGAPGMAAAQPAQAVPASLAGSDAPRWQSIGPDGPALVNSLAFDPQRPRIAFAGMAGGGIARSTDAGLTWRTSSVGLTDPYISGLIVHPRLSRLIYARNRSSQLVRSLDGGLSWRELAAPGRRLAAFAPVPTDPALVYAGSDAGLFVSHDSGDTWRRVGGDGLPRFYGVASLAVDAKDARLLYAGIVDYHHFGLWASQDSGQTWQRRLRTVPYQLVCDPQRSGTVYLLEFGILQRSRDQGVTWEAYFSGVGGAGNGAALGLVFDPRHAWIAYVLSYAEVQSLQHPAALYKTADDGAHWQPLTVGSPGYVFTNALAVSPAGTLLFSSDLPGGFYRSTDGGASWALGGSGLINTGVVAVAFGIPGTFFASTGMGVSRTRDGGVSWSPVLQTPAYITALAGDRLHPETLYASTSLPSLVAPTVLWKTTDSGDTWAPLPYPGDLSAGIQVVDLAVDPTDPEVVYIAAQDALVGDPGGHGVYRSPDGGKTWIKTFLPALDFSGLAVVADQAGTVWAIWQEGAYKSTDFGQSWNQVLSVGQGSYLHAIAVAPSNPDVIWVLGGFTFYSADGGATWHRFPGLVRPLYFGVDFILHPLAIDPADPYTLYVAFLGGVSRRSLGSEWEHFDAGLINRETLAIEFDPADPRHLVVGTNGAGVYELRFAPSP